MSEKRPGVRYRFGVFEADPALGELRHKGLRVRIPAQPFQILVLLLERPGELLTREEICRLLWPDDTFVDYEHGVNSAVNRLREALGDKAASPRFIETLARRGYRFIAPVERVEERIASEALETPAAAEISVRESGAASSAGASAEVEGRVTGGLLASTEDLPQTSGRLARTLFVLLQLMYVGFYIGALANLAEIEELVRILTPTLFPYYLILVSSVVLIPVRTFVILAVLFKAPGLRRKLMTLWPFLLCADVVWSLSPFLLLHHISFGLALACVPLLVYSPFAQRSLVLMGAGEDARGAEQTA